MGRRSWKCVGWPVRRVTTVVSLVVYTGEGEEASRRHVVMKTRATSLWVESLVMVLSVEALIELVYWYTRIRSTVRDITTGL